LHGAIVPGTPKRDGAHDTLESAVTTQPSEQGLVLLARFASITQAEFLRMALADGGIQAVVLSETAAGWRPELGAALGIELHVSPLDLKAAVQVQRAVSATRKDGQP
jgi:hypothetical protein